MNDREEIDQYLAMWDQARKEFQEEAPKVRKDDTGVFYGFMHNLDASVEEGGPGEEEAEHWNDVYYRALEMSGEEQLVTEAEEKPKPKKKKDAPKKKAKKKEEDVDDAPEVDEDEDGFGKDLTPPGKGVKFNVNPTHFASKGQDSKMRVTPNWTDGDELRELAKLKALMYDLESEMLGTDIRGGDPEPIRIRLVRLQKQCESLSQKLIPDPKTDVS